MTPGEATFTAFMDAHKYMLEGDWNELSPANQATWEGIAEAAIHAFSSKKSAKRSPDPKYKAHASYGLIGWARVSGHQQMFGAVVDTGHHVRLRIGFGLTYTDDIGIDRFYDDGVVTEIAMTESQFALFLTTPNSGLGTPCTLLHYPSGPLLFPEPPPNEGLNIQAKLKRDVKRASERHQARAARAVEAIRAMVGDRIPAKQKLDFDILMSQISDTLTSDIEFARTRLDESAADLSQRVRTEVEVAINVRLHQLGMEAAATNINALVAVPALPNRSDE